MRRVFYEDDADLEILKDKTVGVIGFGNQGYAQSMNLRDSGVNVVIGNREDQFKQLALSAGFAVYSIRDAARIADVIIMLIPDEVQPTVFEHEIKPELKLGKTLVFASGFNIHFGLIKPPSDVDVVLVAPKMVGKSVRSLYLKGLGAPALIAIHNDATGNALRIGLAIAKGIGATRVGVIESTFEEETVTDLFSEQALSYGQLIKYGFEVLVEAGYDPLVTQLELYGSGEIIEIAKLMVQEGLVAQLVNHSTTSQYGQLTRGKRVISEEIKSSMRKILDEIRSGVFVKEYLEEVSKGYLTIKKLLEEANRHPIIEVERKVRELIKSPLD